MFLFYLYKAHTATGRVNGHKRHSFLPTWREEDKKQEKGRAVKFGKGKGALARIIFHRGADE